VFENHILSSCVKKTFRVIHRLLSHDALPVPRIRNSLSSSIDLHPVYRSSIYKASIARAAAPRRPAAWVAWAAPPVNWEAADEAPAAADEALDAAAEVAEEALDAAAEVADARTDEIAAAALEATLEASAALEEAADAAAEVALATAEEAAAAALEAAGIWMGTPASWQVFSTAWMVVAWSAAEHAFSTQGFTVARRAVPFWQWHLKSVREEQPSDPRGPTKQVNYDTLVRASIYWLGLRTAQDGMLSS
jgi:hypothetical protein